MTARRRSQRAQQPRARGGPSIPVSAETYERLRAHCNRTGMSMAEVIDALTTDLNNGN